MKPTPWVIAGGILLFCRPWFSILLFLPPVPFALVPPEVQSAATDRTFHPGEEMAQMSVYWRG